MRDAHGQIPSMSMKKSENITHFKDNTPILNYNVLAILINRIYGKLCDTASKSCRSMKHSVVLDKVT